MKPTVVWITGLSGAGKTTTAELLEHYCFYKGHKVELIDGDDLREKNKSQENIKLGYTMEDRWSNVYRAIYEAKKALETKDIVIVAMISPLESMREEARHILTSYSDARFLEVFMDTPLEVCEQRDSKGLYEKARAGEIKNFTGIDSPYEAPEFPNIRLHYKTTLGKTTPEKAVNIIYNFIAATNKI
jgi:bifunctional enzyme CysN/CysC